VAGGAAIGRDKVRLNPSGLTPTTGFNDPTNPLSVSVNRAPLTSAFTDEDTAFAGGVQAGCNMQMGQWLVGGEVDLNWTDIRAETTNAFGPIFLPMIGGFANSPPGFASPHTEHVINQLQRFSTLRGRVGYAWDRSLAFATAGLAAARIQSNTDVQFVNDFPTNIYLSNLHGLGGAAATRLGLAVGGGFEHALTQNWSLKAEYLYLDFKSFDYASPCITAFPCAPGPGPVNPLGFAWGTHVETHDHLLRVGINYKLW
jgi:outer membrane immunogenic protein